MAHPTETPSHGAKNAFPVPDLRERGGPLNGQPQLLDRRLFVQLLAFGGCRDWRPMAHELEQARVESVLYEDLSDPRGIAILSFSEDPSFFTGKLRTVLNETTFAALIPKPELTMTGRTYALGYEPNLEEWLLNRPRKTASNPETPWAVWYPLRRTGAFQTLAHEEQGRILKEHSQIGRSFSEGGFASDIRLSCAGLDKNDNDFVIGLIGRELHPLSALVEAMRKTVQTSTYIQNMGPFFIGRAAWRWSAK